MIYYTTGDEYGLPYSSPKRITFQAAHEDAKTLFDNAGGKQDVYVLKCTTQVQAVFKQE